MMKNTKIILLGFVLISSCSTMMAPAEVNSILPTMTKTTLISQAQAEQNLKENKCRYLVKDRNYVAPIGFTKKGDLRYGAIGIDEWVKLDGGNAYVLKNYRWLSVDENGTTQLHLDFDTLLCD